MDQMHPAGSLLTNEIILEHKEELPIEMDFVLPDDCPDMMKILRTSLRLGNVATSAGADGISMEGTVIAAIQYIADTGLLHTVESRSNFSKNARYDTAEPVQPERVWVRLRGETEYLNARAVNQRRVEVRGAMGLYPQASATMAQNYLGECMLDGVECRYLSSELTYPTMRAQYSFNVDEDRALPETLPEIGTVLRTEGRAALTDYKLIDGKVVTKGELTLRVVYMPADADSENDAPAAATWTLPVSCLAELEGVDGDTACCLHYALAWSSVDPKLDESGARRAVQCRAEIRLSCTAHKTETVTGMTDAFALRHPVELSKRTLSVPQLVSCIDQPVVVSRTYELPMGGVQEVFDISASAGVGGGHRQEGGISLPIRLELAALVRDDNGRPAGFERTEEIAQLIPGDGDNLMARDLAVQVTDVSCSLSDDSLTVNVTLALTGCLYERRRLELIDGMEIDEETELPPAGAALTLYYADPGTALWDVAKAFGTTVASLRSENNLAEDTVPVRTMLMVVAGQ